MELSQDNVKETMSFFTSQDGVKAVFRFDKFHSHVPTNSPKKKETLKRFMKVNGQALYSGTMNRFARQKMVNFLKNYFTDCLKQFIKSNNKSTSFKLFKSYKAYNLKLYVGVPVNYSSLQFIYKSQSFRWSTPKKGYPVKQDTVTFDLDNLWPYIKTFQDSLGDSKLIKDDKASILTSTGHITYIPVETIEDRYLEFHLIQDTEFYKTYNHLITPN